MVDVRSKGTLNFGQHPSAYFRNQVFHSVRIGTDIDHDEPVFTSVGRIGRLDFGGYIDVHRRVIAGRIGCADGLEFFPIVVAEEDVVQVQLGVFTLDTPVKNDAARGALLPQDFFRCGQIGQ